MEKKDFLTDRFLNTESRKERWDSGTRKDGYCLSENDDGIY